MDMRKKPEEILQKMVMDNEKKKRGKLKIFFGYAAGVGKTYAMLEAAHKAKALGTDVVVGYVEPHMRPETSELLNGLEILPVLNIEYNHMKLKEFDLSAALSRKPELIIVDELAHTNLGGLRHHKRYQDVKELIENGINVYTTLNVQHIESLNDIVASITNVLIRERVPDTIFDEADEVELIDIEPNDLLQRLKDGKIYQKKEANIAMNHFFTENNLISLREIALRRCADRITNMAGKNNEDEVVLAENMLVCISPSLSSAKVIRTAARMAAAFKAPLTALYVETSEYLHMNEKNRKQLAENINLAKQFGASVEVIGGDDIAFTISEYARQLKISKIIIGRSPASKGFFNRMTLVDQLIANASFLDIYVIPVKEFKVSKYRKRIFTFQGVLNRTDVLISIGVLVFISFIGLIFKRMDINESNIMMIYILGVVMIAATTRYKIYSLLSSVLSVLIFNFLFTEPYLTFQAYDPGYPITFLVMFLVALMTSTLAVKMKNNARKSVQVAYRTKILLETNQIIQQMETKQEIVKASCCQLMKLLNRSIIFYPEKDGKLDEPVLFAVANEDDAGICMNDNESAVANWVYKNNKHAGASTHTLGNAKCLYLAIRTNKHIYGVIGIQLSEETKLDSFENGIVLSVLGEMALALEIEKSRDEKMEASIKAKNEELRSQLLRMISHDLRTPLTSINGNVSILLSQHKNLSEDRKNEIYQMISNDASWLIDLVENLLSLTRMENDQMKLNLSTELVSDLMNEALKHLNYDKIFHQIRYKQEDEFIIVKVDARLFIQLMINLIDNAIKYTQEGSNIEIHVYKRNNRIMIDVADDGPGISDEDKAHIFEVFYTANRKISDSRRSLGLGLYLCQSIVNAHDGTISVLNNSPCGSIFRVELPEKEAVLHE